MRVRHSCNGARCKRVRSHTTTELVHSQHRLALLRPQNEHTPLLQKIALPVLTAAPWLHPKQNTTPWTVVSISHTHPLRLAGGAGAKLPPPKLLLERKGCKAQPKEPTSSLRQHCTASSHIRDSPAPCGAGLSQQFTRARRASLNVAPLYGAVVERAAHRGLVVAAVHADGVAGGQVPQARGAVRRRGDQVRGIHRKHAVPHPPLVACMHAPGAELRQRMHTYSVHRQC